VAVDGDGLEFDVSRPSVARTYDAVLGGRDNYPPDEAVAEELRKTVPQITDLAWWNRAVLGRGVRYLAAEAGMRQFIDLGAGLPTMDNTHEVARRHAPDARVVYVDIDPIVLAHGKALLAADERTAVITADLRKPCGVLDHPDTRRLIDRTKPVAILLVGVLHHLHDNENPGGIVDAYMDAVPAGSHLFITHFCDSGPDARALQKTFLTFLGSGRFRTVVEIRRYFAGLEMVEPGLVYLPEWRPDGPVNRWLTTTQRLTVAGIGRKS
jgi:hypothetical protein